MTLESHVKTLPVAGRVYTSGPDGEPLAVPGMRELKALWLKAGDELTREIIEANPGSRPWAWWKWTRPELKLPPPPFGWQLEDHGRQGGVSRRHRERPSGFLQRHYLEEHNLLSDTERAALAESDALWARIGTNHAGTSPA
jgi:hypothetical protein